MENRAGAAVSGLTLLAWSAALWHVLFIAGSTWIRIKIARAGGRGGGLEKRVCGHKAACSFALLIVLARLQHEPTVISCRPTLSVHF